MAERDNLPAISHARSEVALATQSGTLVARGLEAVRRGNKKRVLARSETPSIIEPDKLIFKLDQYSQSTESFIGIPRDFANVSDFYDRSICNIDALFRILKGVYIEDQYHLFARFCPDPFADQADPSWVTKLDVPGDFDGDFQSMLESALHYGYWYKYFSIVDECDFITMYDLMTGLRFDHSLAGAISALFVASTLPMVGAYWHGCYAMGRYVPIPDQAALHGLLNEHDFDLSGSTLSEDSVLNYTLGLRVAQTCEDTRCACLGCDENGSIIDFKFRLDTGGHFIKEESLRLISTSKVLY